ncbi:MAG: hypothetical protein PVF20_08185 [Desulfobacterales bacterium]
MPENPSNPPGAMAMGCCPIGDAPVCDWSPGTRMGVTDRPMLAPKDDLPRSVNLPLAGMASVLQDAALPIVFFKSTDPAGRAGPPIYLANLTFLC